MDTYAPIDLPVHMNNFFKKHGFHGLERVPPLLKGNYLYLACIITFPNKIWLEYRSTMYG